MTGRISYPEQFKTLAAQRVPSVMKAFAWMLTVAILAAGLFLVFAPWVQTTSGFGTVTALNPNDRLQEVNALVSGRIQEWYVRDGVHVTVGDPIVRIADLDPWPGAGSQSRRNPSHTLVAQTTPVWDPH